MEQEKVLGGSLLTVTRRYAAGIDVSEDAVRLAVVSRRLRTDSSVCVERLETVPLAEGAVVNGDFIDRAAVVAALREAFGRLPGNGTRRALRCAMGLPASATHTFDVPLARLIEPRNGRMPTNGDPLGVLEPAVLAEAERAIGIGRDALAVDWSVRAHENGHAQVSIAATQRRFVEARAEAAAQAGIALSAIDGEPASALRAMRQTGLRELETDARYLAVWAERNGIHGWIVEAGEVEREMRYPAASYASIGDALRDLVGDDAPLEGIYVGGDIDVLQRAAFPPTALSTMFNATTLPFEPAPFCNGAADIDPELRHSPRFAVAFGLALREVLQ
jgi:Tfp pilus assembly PilM family ATPase